MKNSRQTFFSLLFFLTAFSFSQQIRFRHITSEDGLSTNLVRSVIQDDKGFMWFATQDGLNKYDGFQIKIFKKDPTNPNSLISSDLTCLTQINPDLIMIGTTDGVNFFNPITSIFYRLNEPFKGLKTKINAICKYDEEHALVGSDLGFFQVNLFDKKVVKSFFPDTQKVIIRTIKEVNGTFYIGTSGMGLWQLSAKGELQKVNMHFPEFINSKKVDLTTVNDIEQYAGKLYLATEGYGIVKVGHGMEVESVISFAKLDLNSDYTKDFVVKDNKLYVASAFGFLVHNLISEETVIYKKSQADFAINSDACNSVFIDNQNNLWIGTMLGGVNISFFRSLKFPNSKFNYETLRGNIFSFCETSPGNFLVGGEKALLEISALDGKITDHSKILLDNTALCILKEDETTYWIGTWGIGILKYDIKTKKCTRVLNFEVGGTITNLKIYDGYLYAGSIGDGLFKINLKTLETIQFKEKEGLIKESVNCVYKDNSGNFWIGTYDGGLMKLNGSQLSEKLNVDKIFINTGKVGQIASNVITSINQDKSGTLWVGTSTGLSKLLPDGSFRNFYEKDGLSNSYIYSLLKDSLENFWMSTNSGLIRFNPLLAENEITFKNYGIKDGLVNVEYNMGAVYGSESGMMYFGGSKGFNLFRPTQIKDNLNPPKAYVIGYKRAGEDVVTDSSIIYKKHLNLNWTENYFQFELVALDYTDPSKNKFKYKLEGYDQDWSAPTSVRYVSYTELPGGEYTFKVKAANNDGIWNETPYEITITVVPPFWKTKTFYVLLILFGAAIVYAFIQYRTRAMKRENKILENKVALRTKELAEKNRDITSSIEYAKRIQEAILPARDQIFSELKKIFILYRPKDIVSGDFYWFGNKNGVKIFAVVDCTGHGVPGAFMSMIGHNLLNQIVKERNITDPAEILNNIHKGIQAALRQGTNEINTNDGMDVSLLTINESKKEVKWAGANRPLVLLNSDGTMSKIDGNKFPVGGAQTDGERIFTTQTINAQGPAMAYMFSDGYADQFGGDKGKKFMVKRLNELFATIYTWDATRQKQELEAQFEAWRKFHEQIDDVLVVGIELNN